MTSDAGLVLAMNAAPGGIWSESVSAAGPSPCRIVTADFDEDGQPDLFVGNRQVRQGSLLLGHSDGSFDPPLSVPAVHVIGRSVAGDFDEDDATDLALVSSEEHTVALLTGRGDGTFRPLPGRRDSALGDTARGLLIADLDLDGNADVAVTHDPDLVSVLLGNGAGQLADPVAHTVGTKPFSVAAGIVNSADAIPDLVVSNLVDVSVLLGLGGGNFYPEIRVSLDAEPTAMALADINGDGLDDLVVTHGSPTNAVVVRAARGDGTFGGGRSQAVGDDPRHVAVADLDGDGYRDLVTANHASGDVSVLRGAAFGSFQAETRFAVGGNPDFVAVGDLDGDGRLDLIVSTGRVTLLHGNGDATFGPASVTDVDDEYGNARSIADLDGDGRLDLAGWGTRSDTATLLFGDGALHLRAAGELAVPGKPMGLALGDLDEDGRGDLVVATDDPFTAGGGFVSVLINGGPTTLGFAADKTTLGWPYAEGSTAYEVYRGDLADLFDGDGDGLPDWGYGECQAVNDPRRNEWIDADDLPPMTGRFYLVGSVDAEGLRDLGTTSAGLVRVPSSFCP